MLNFRFNLPVTICRLIHRDKIAQYYLVGPKMLYYGHVHITVPKIGKKRPAKISMFVDIVGIVMKLGQLNRTV